MELVRMNIRQTDPCPIDPGLSYYISSTQLLLPRFKSFPPYKGVTTLNSMSNPLRSFSEAPSRAFFSLYFPRFSSVARQSPAGSRRRDTLSVVHAPCTRLPSLHLSAAASFQLHKRGRRDHHPYLSPQST
jgi:hypothetical protein